ncbi:hypothetical protein GGI02_000296 [Coemansia sp. RSA 2322]|nr:hypothetical protein GGI02_000296 [Coemansia sp. RSA 2322]
MAPESPWWWMHRAEDSGRVGLASGGLRATLKQRVLSYASVLALSSLMLWTALPLFYGSMYKRSHLVGNIRLQVIDLDGGPVGANVSRIVLGMPPTQLAPVWEEMRGVESLAHAEAWVRDHAWGALVVNPGASRGAAHALTVVQSTGRMPVAEMMFVQSALAATAAAACQRYAAELLAGYRALPSPLLPDPPALLAPITYETVDVAPESFSLAPVLTAFGFLACLLPMVGAMILWKLTSFAFFLRVRFRHLLLMWLSLIAAMALILSLYLSLAFLAFRGPSYNSVALAYTPASFFKIWFTAAAVAMALGLWLFTWFLNLSPMFLSVPSVCTVIPNIISCLATFELAPKFYRFMNATPFFNGSRIIHYIISGAYPTLARNISVLLAEILVMAAALAVSVWFRQFFVLRGISDPQGWYRGSIYFNSPVPYHKDNSVAAEMTSSTGDAIRGEISSRSDHTLSTILQPTAIQSQRASTDIHITDYHDDNVELTTGNLGV